MHINKMLIPMRTHAYNAEMLGSVWGRDGWCDLLGEG